MQLLTVNEVCSLLHIARATLYARLAAGAFPKPIYVTPKAPRWREDELREWVESRERVKPSN